MTAYFITSTGTDIGKTFITTQLCRDWQAQRKQVYALKPVMTGYTPQNAHLSDAGILLNTLGQAVTEKNIHAISPWRFTALLSPDLAAAREGKHLDFEKLLEFCQNKINAHHNDNDLLLIEGIGGCMVPLTDQHTVRDWIAALGIPTILVTGSYLGSLSHTLTAMAALKEVNVNVIQIIVNERTGSSVSVEDTCEILRKHLGNVLVSESPLDSSMRKPLQQLPAKAAT